MNNEQSLKELKKINCWLRFQNSEKMKEFLQELDEDDQIIFEFLDGNTTMRDVASVTNFSSKTPVVNRIAEWRSLGLVFKNESGKWEHIGSMSSFGLDAPEPLGEDEDE